MKKLLPAEMVCVNRRRISTYTFQSVHLSFHLVIDLLDHEKPQRTIFTRVSRIQVETRRCQDTVEQVEQE